MLVNDVLAMSIVEEEEMWRMLARRGRGSDSRADDADGCITVGSSFIALNLPEPKFKPLSPDELESLL